MSSKYLELRCKECNKLLVVQDPAIKRTLVASQLWLPDFDYCLTCMTKHCCSIRCGNCTRVKKFPCKMRSVKETYFDNND